MKIVNFSSQKQGSGKGRILSNLAYYLALRGKKVAIFDASLGNHSCFKHFRRSEEISHLGDFLSRNCNRDDFLINLKSDYSLGEDLFLFYMGCTLDELFLNIRDNPENEVDYFYKKLHSLSLSLGLDYLFISGQLGFTRDALFFMTLADVNFSVFTPDLNNYQALVLEKEVLDKFEKREHYLIINQVLANYDPQNIREEIARVFPGKKVLGFFPLFEDGGANLFKLGGSPGEVNKSFQVEITELARFFL